MTQDENRFGGKNPAGLYVPMTDTEQEVLLRLVESQALRVYVPMTGEKITPVKVGYGDKRVAVTFLVTFKGTPVPITTLAVELWAEGVLLLKKPYLVADEVGNPRMVGEGVTWELQWDIAIDHMDPLLVKALKPGAFGITSRRLDKETGERTFLGNMTLDKADQDALRFLEKGEASVRRTDVVEVAQANKPKAPR
jgi:hypothetical protein